MGFGLQFALVQHLEFAAAFSALALGMIYMGLARFLMGGRTMLLGETCLALGVIFASLAIPLGLDARWTSAAWAVEGAGIFWLGLRQHRPFARAFALLLQLGSSLAFLSELQPGESSLLDGAPLGALMLGAALLFSFHQLRKAMPEQTSPWERQGLPLLACLGPGVPLFAGAVVFLHPGHGDQLGLGRVGDFVGWPAPSIAHIPVHRVRRAIVGRRVVPAGRPRLGRCSVKGWPWLMPDSGRRWCWGWQRWSGPGVCRWVLRPKHLKG